MWQTARPCLGCICLRVLALLPLPIQAVSGRAAAAAAKVRGMPECTPRNLCAGVPCSPAEHLRDCRHMYTWMLTGCSSSGSDCHRVNRCCPDCRCQAFPKSLLLAVAVAFVVLLRYAHAVLTCFAIGEWTWEAVWSSFVLQSGDTPSIFRNTSSARQSGTSKYQRAWSTELVRHGLVALLDTTTVNRFHLNNTGVLSHKAMTAGHHTPPHH